MRVGFVAAGVAACLSSGLALAPRSASAATSAGASVAATGSAAALSPAKALVSVLINPLGLLTHYDVQYGTHITYGRRTAVRTVASGAGAATYDVRLTGLRPSTTYHYRVVATNPLGTTDGVDESFATWPVQIPFRSTGVVSKNNRLYKAADGSHPRGWIELVHGGGWQVVGPKAVAAEAPTIRWFKQLGWAVDNVDYRRGEHSLPDVLAAYDGLRHKVGRGTPICVVGQSAGGNLALLVAEHRSSTACVISEGGPTDLVHLQSQPAFTPSVTIPATTGPAWIFNYFVVPSFGINPSVLREWSPVDHAAAIHAAVLLGASTYDDLVPQQQIAELRTAMQRHHATGSIKTALLPGARTPAGQTANFTHAAVTATAEQRWRHDEQQLLAHIANRR